MQIANGRRAASALLALAASQLTACNGGGSGGTTSASVPTGSSAVASATVSWAAPTQDTNGSPVSELSGYRIYYGTTSHQYSTTIDVPNPALVTYVVEALTVGVTYYFAVAAVSAGGAESALSPEVTATIS